MVLFSFFEYGTVKNEKIRYHGIYSCEYPHFLLKYGFHKLKHINEEFTITVNQAYFEKKNSFRMCIKSVFFISTINQICSLILSGLVYGSLIV